MQHTQQSNVRIEEVQVPGPSYPARLGDEIDEKYNGFSHEPNQYNFSCRIPLYIFLLNLFASGFLSIAKAL
jgi:hypothetical protein